MSGDGAFEISQRLYSWSFAFGFFAFVCVMATISAWVWYGYLPTPNEDVRVTFSVTLALIAIVSFIYFAPMVFIESIRVRITDGGIFVYRRTLLGTRLKKIIPREQVSEPQIVVTPWPRTAIADLSFDSFGKFYPPGSTAVWIKTRRRVDKDLLIGVDRPHRVVRAVVRLQKNLPP